MNFEVEYSSKALKQLKEMDRQQSHTIVSWIEKI